VRRLSSSDTSPRVACVGGGYWGPNLIRNVHTQGALALLCDRQPETLAALEAHHPGIPATHDYEEVLASDVDAVLLATPAATHHALTRRALEAGKHVFVEKPLALTAAEARDLAETADRLGRVLMVGHILEYHPAFERLVELVREGAIGEVRHLRSSRLSLGKLRHEENVMWSFAPHDLSLLHRVLSDSIPERIRAFGTTVLQPGIPDTVHLDLAYTGGVTAHVHVSWLEPIKLHQLVVMGTEGMLVFEDSRPTDKLRMFDRGFRQESGSWVVRSGEERTLPFEAGEPMAREIAHFLDCIRTGKRPRTDGWSGVRVLEVLEAAQRELDLPTPTGSPA